MPTAIVSNTTNPDAGLLKLCKRFHEQHAAAVALENDDAMSSMLAKRWRTSDKISAIHATSAAGIRAKALVALFLIDEQHGSYGFAGRGSTAFAVAVLRDLAEEAQS